MWGLILDTGSYSKAESMSKHYKCPCLLIEFDPEKTFELQSKHDLGGDIKMDSICSKLALLTMHFPKLRILWSRSPHETLKLFKKLKRYVIISVSSETSDSSVYVITSGFDCLEIIRKST